MNAKVSRDASGGKVLEAADERSALLAAELEGAEVEILSARTETSTTWARPDGSFRVDSALSPIRVRRGDSWEPVDYRIVKRGGKVLPAAAPFDVRFGDGTSRMLASLTAGNTGVDLQWPQSLPAPALRDGVAVYPIGEDRDLRMAATAKGVEQSLVLKTRTDTLGAVRLPLRLRGLTSRPSDGDTIELVSSSGKPVYVIGAPVMYDAGKGTPRRAAVEMRIEEAGGGAQLVLQPDANFLRDPDTTYPVTIDPTISAVTNVKDTYVSSSLFGTALGESKLAAGVFSDGILATTRSYLQFATPTRPDGSSLKDAVIEDAKIRVYNYQSDNCTASKLNVYPVTATWSTSMGWGTQPAINTSADYAGGASFSGCDQSYNNLDVRKIVAAWVNGTLANHGVSLRGENAAGTFDGKLMCSMDVSLDSFAAPCDSSAEIPTLSVTYNTYPTVTAASWLPRSDFTEQTSSGAVTTAFSTTKTPHVFANVTDHDGGSVRAVFDIYDGTTAVITGLAGSAVTSSGQSRALVPAGKLIEGKAYTVRAWASDGKLRSKLSSQPPAMSVDTTPPAAVVIDRTRVEWPDDGSWNKQPGETGHVGIAASGAGSLVYWLDDGFPTTEKRANDGLTRWLPVTPETAGTHVLYVMQKDRAGNASPVFEYTFNVGDAVVTSPLYGDESARRFVLSAKAKSEFTNATFEYRRSDGDPWAKIPDGAFGHVRLASGAAVTWPVATSEVPDRNSVSDIVSGLRWDALATLGGSDGLIDIRAVFTGSRTVMTAPVTVVVHPEAPSAATAEVGPGTVNLLTGNFVLNGKESAFGMSVKRTANSRAPKLGEDLAGMVAPFGPEWSVGGTDEVADSPYKAVHVAASAATTANVILDDNSSISFSKTGPTSWQSEPGADDLTLSGDGSAETPFTLQEVDGAVTRFARGAGTLHPMHTTTRATASAGSSKATWESVTVGGVNKLRLTRLTAPTTAVPRLTDCDVTSPPAGCRVLQLVYTADTAAKPATGTFGAYPGRADRLVLLAAAPGSATATAVTIAQYRYDDLGRLREVTDPRVAGTKLAYGYDAEGRVTTLTPPGHQPWTFSYGTAGTTGDPNAGRLLTATRPTLAPGTTATVTGSASSSVVYDVPVTRADGGPYDMTETTTKAWGQSAADVPTDATAIFPADQVPASNTGAQAAWARASVWYMSPNGAVVNKAAPGGHIGFTSYDSEGRATRQLSPSNRALAVRAANDPAIVELGLSSVETAVRAELLSVVSVFDQSGLERERFGPLRLISVRDDAIPTPGRAHTVNTYDEGRPAGAPVSGLITTTKTGARLLDAVSDVDVRTRTSEYDWNLGLSTKTVVDPGTGALNIVETTQYDTEGRITKTTKPKAGAAGTTLVYYYTAGPHPTVSACGSKPVWADMVCQTGPSGAITGAPAGQPTGLPTTRATYTQLGLPDVATETVLDAAGATKKRVTDTDYDAAGRLTKVTVTGDLGTAVPVISALYSSQDGALTSTRATEGTVVTSINRTYDTLGREIAYSDADGAVTKTEYDALDRPSKVTGGDGSTTAYTYDHATEPRGMPTGVTDSVAGAVSGRYDANGAVTVQNLPGGVTMSQQIDTAGVPSARTWAKNEADGTVTTLLDEEVTVSVHNQWVARSGRASSQRYRYDRAGRLVGVNDTAGGVCTSRVYSFDANGNRTHRKQASGAAGEVCPAAPSLGTANHVYDSADRIVDAGYTYDAFGRTTKLPGTAAIDYYTNDRVREIRKNTDEKQTWTLDPAFRFRKYVITAKDAAGALVSATKTNHYAGEGDSPAWIDEGNGTISRYVKGLGGDIIARTGRSGSARIQVTNLHGDVAIDLDPSHSVAPTVYDSDEYGVARGTQKAARYGWLGGKQRSRETPTGVMLMGVRLYNPATGRFLSVDPVPGGNENTYNYPNDPVNKVDLDGLYDYYLYYTAGYTSSTATRVFSRIRANFGKLFPLQGAAARLSYVGQNMDLWYHIPYAPDIYMPVKVSKIDTRYWRFDVRRWHPDPMGSWVSFLFYKSGPYELKLRVHGYIKSVPTAVGNFQRNRAAKTWARFAYNLRNFV